MNKQSVHIKLDLPTYLILKNKKINISGVANELFKRYVNFEQSDNENAFMILEELQQKKELLEKTNEEISILSIKLTHVQENEEKDKEKHFKELVAMKEGMLRAGFLHHDK